MCFCMIFKVYVLLCFKKRYKTKHFIYNSIFKTSFLTMCIVSRIKLYSLALVVSARLIDNMDGIWQVTSQTRSILKRDIWYTQIYWYLIKLRHELQNIAYNPINKILWPRLPGNGVYIAQPRIRESNQPIRGLDPLLAVWATGNHTGRWITEVCNTSTVY